MLGNPVANRRFAIAALAAAVTFAVGCSSNNNKSTSNTTTNAPATTAATRAASAAAAPSTAATTARSAGSPAAATTGGSPAAGGAVAMTFQPPGGSADWANLADGCHGVKAPAGAEARKASDTGVTESEIKLGSAFGLTGPGSVYAPIIKTISKCFDLINADGGIYGRKLSLLIEDDQYTPANTPPLVKKLIEQDKVFALVSDLGTPTNTAVFDYVNDQKVPHLLIASGAAKWGADVKSHPWSIGFQPDYFSAGQVYAKYIQQNWKGKKIGVLRQNDDFGKDYVDGMKKVLGDKGSADNPIVDEETYETTAADVNGQITNLKNKGAEVFFLVAIPKYAGLAFKAASDQGWKPNTIMTDVALDPSVPQIAGGDDKWEGTITDAYYHTVSDASDPSVVAVKDWITKNLPDQQFVNNDIFGYMQAQMYVEIFKRAGVNPTRKSIMQAVESFKGYQIPQLLKGITVNTGPEDHRPIKCIQLLKITGGQYQFLPGDPICASS